MTEILEISQIQGNITEIRKILGNLGIKTVSKKAVSRLSDLLNTMRSDLIVTIEYDYVDATYRDEYYRFYATKYREYKRNCAKMSFFESGILKPKEKIDYSKANEISQQFLGFVVLRPIDACIGRNVISVTAKRNPFDNIAICKAAITTTAIGLKVTVEGFPHSSQDGEMMTCAETSLWSISEYFGHKYSMYRPISPSEILEAMRPSSSQRQLPSKGLTFNQISIGLKSIGFNPEVYQLYKKNEKTGVLELNEEMKEVLGCYVESGFPLALCLQGSKVGHAVVCVGRSNTQGTLKREYVNGRNIYFCNQALDEIVVNDDNVSCYQTTNIVEPMAYHKGDDWKDVKLTNFIVPLPSKVYLDAFNAIKHSKDFLGTFAPEDSVARTYLASCRSFRNHVATSQLMPNENKNLLMGIDLPRFIWITEYGSMKDYQEGFSTGIIILDATESTESNTNSLILAVNDKSGVGYNKRSQNIDYLNLTKSFKLEKYNKNIN